MHAPGGASQATELVRQLVADVERIHTGVEVAGIRVDALAAASDGAWHAYLCRRLGECSPLTVIEALTVRAATGACSLVLLAPTGADASALPADTGEAEGLGLVVAVPGAPLRVVRPPTRVQARPAAAAILRRWIDQTPVLHDAR